MILEKLLQFQILGGRFDFSPLAPNSTGNSQEENRLYKMYCLGFVSGSPGYYINVENHTGNKWNNNEVNFLYWKILKRMKWIE